MAGKTMRWGIWGTSGVAAKFAAGLKAVPGAELACVLSRDPARAKAFARKTGATTGTTDLAEAAATAGILYIATPTALHATHAVAALEAGLHVLVEKPLAADATEARRIAEVAEASGRFAMEAMWTRFQPALARARALLAEGAIGTPRLLRGSFGIATLPGSSLHDPVGGGALRQRGIYPLSLAADLLGMPEEAQALKRIGESGIDEDIAVSLRHPGGALSQISASTAVNAPNGLEILGDKGSLRFEGRIWRPSALLLKPYTPRAAGGGGRLEAFRESPAGQAAQRLLMPLMDRRGTTRIKAPFSGNGYGHQAEAVMAAIAAGETGHPLMPLEDSIALTALMDRLLDAQGTDAQKTDAEKTAEGPSS